MFSPRAAAALYRRSALLEVGGFDEDFFSCTMRTARSRISGEKRFDFLFMTPSSQSLEPPQNPGRFTLLRVQFVCTSC